MKLTPEQKEHMTHILERYPLSAAYLFGSQASGGSGALSDVDIGVLFQKNINKEEQEKLENEMYSELVHLLSTDYVDIINIEKAPTLIRYNASVKSVPLFIRDRFHHISARMQSIHLFEDFLPYLNQIRKQLKRRYS